MTRGNDPPVTLEPFDVGVLKATACNPGARFALAWDRFVQFNACASAFAAVQDSLAVHTVLDVGAGDGTLAMFLPQLTVYTAKVDTANGGMPDIKAKAFDLVVATDALENLEPRQRGIFIAQLARIASCAVILNFALPTSATAQKVVAAITDSEAVQRRVKVGLPYSSTVHKQFEDIGLRCSSRHHTSRALWATFQALKIASPDSASALSRYLVEDGECENVPDPLYETVFAAWT
jgi:hypothetical protein